MTNQILFSARRAGKLHAMYTTLNPGVPFQKWKEMILKTSSRSVEGVMKKRMDQTHRYSGSPFKKSWVEEMFEQQFNELKKQRGL